MIIVNGSYFKFALLTLLNYLGLQTPAAVKQTMANKQEHLLLTNGQKQETYN